MPYIDSKAGRHLMIVDPDTGLQIPHVVSCDPDPGRPESEPEAVAVGPDPDSWEGFQDLDDPEEAEAGGADGWIEVYAPQPCGLGPGMNMQLMVNGQFEERNYTFMRTQDPMTGARDFLKIRVYCRFDVVHKDTGEVFFEAVGEQAPLRTRDPGQWAEEYQSRPEFARIGVPETRPAGPETTTG